MNFNKSFTFCFSTQNTFPNKFEDKKTQTFFHGGRSSDTSQRNYTKLICIIASKTVIESKLFLCSGFVPLG